GQMRRGDGFRPEGGPAGIGPRSGYDGFLRVPVTGDQDTGYGVVGKAAPPLKGGGGLAHYPPPVPKYPGSGTDVRPIGPGSRGLGPRLPTAEVLALFPFAGRNRPA